MVEINDKKGMFEKRKVMVRKVMAVQLNRNKLCLYEKFSNPKKIPNEKARQIVIKGAL